MASLHSLHKQFTTHLSDFSKSSTSLFRILYTHPPPPPTSAPSSQPQPRHCQTLFVLDSSFNPPSRAHLAVARAAVLSAVRYPSPQQQHHHRRLLFLLATENADKAPKPAAFPDRLVMMVLMARALDSQLSKSIAEIRRNGSTDAGTGDADDVGIPIDIAVTKKPYFTDKAAAIDASGAYTLPPHSTLDSGNREESVPEQIHLTGFDTLIRIFTKKYYGEQGFRALDPFLSKHRVRAMLRTGEGGKYGDRAMQENWLRKLAEKEEGFRREWLERVEVVDGEEDGVAGEVEGVSSTRVREGVKCGDWGLVRELVGGEVAGWVRERGLYLEEEGEGEGGKL